jgi:CubicO group peptidase (beta-lactamase class C family)
VTNPLDQVSTWPVPNAAAAVVGPSGVVATTGDLTRRFRLASVTKPLSSLAVLVAFEEGAIDLDDPVTDPALAAALPGATLRHLISHASGIAADVPERAAAVGNRRIYSNAGFDALGAQVATAVEMPFAHYLHEAVFEPLGMNGSSLEGSPAKDGISTVGDLVAVVQQLLSPSGLLDPSTVTALRTVQFPGLRGVVPGFGMQQHCDWGLGFEIRDDKSPHWTSTRNSPQTYGHFGQAGTMFWVDPVANLALIALSDRDFGEWAASAWPRLADAVLDTWAT